MRAYEPYETFRATALGFFAVFVDRAMGPNDVNPQTAIASAL